VVLVEKTTSLRGLALVEQLEQQLELEQFHQMLVVLN
jgi:hypothetical protein